MTSLRQRLEAHALDLALTVAVWSTGGMDAVEASVETDHKKAADIREALKLLEEARKYVFHARMYHRGGCHPDCLRCRLDKALGPGNQPT